MSYRIEEVEQSFLNAFPFPPVLFKVVTMIKEEQEPLYKLGREIAKDPVLSAKILALVNSPFYAAKRKISDLPRAISMLGYNEVTAVVLRFVSREALAKAKAGKGSTLYRPRETWLHSVKVAHINRILVRRHNLPFLLEGYLAGLMHDIGKNAIAVRIQPADEKKILEGIRDGSGPLEMEEHVLGFNHVECGLRILKRMNISLDVLQMVRRHHDIMPIDFQHMNFILALSNVLAKYENKEDWEQLDNQLTVQFGMSCDDIDDLNKIYDELAIDMEFL